MTEPTRTGLHTIAASSLTLLALSLSTALHAAEQPDEAKDIEVITVKGRAAQFYFVEESAMATKTPTDYMDLPQAVQVLSQELIRDQAARQTTDLYRSISGVTQFSYSGITARGFRQDQVRYDGVQGDPYSGFSIPQLFNVERVEVLKGPTGMLYGAGQPGGLLNYVTKKPKFENQTDLSLFTGSDDLYGGSIDNTGTLSDDSLAYRMGGFYQSKQGFRNNTDEKNLLLSGGLTWILGDSTDLTLQYDFIDQDLGGHRLRGVPVDDNGNFLTDISYNPNEKSDFQRLEANVWQAILEHEFSGNLTNKTVFRALDNERTQNYHENRGLAEDGRTMTREFRDQFRSTDEWSLTTDFVYQLTAGDIEHTLLFGGDYFSGEGKYTYRVGRGAPSQIPDIDIINPVYGADPSTYLLQQRPDSLNEYSRLGLYVQDQIRLNDHWIVVAGARYDKFEDEIVGADFKASDNSLSPRFGAIYQPSDAMSVFANYTRGFQPQSVSSQLDEKDDIDAGGLLDPETSTQHEIGIKNTWLDGSLLSTVTAYQIVKNDVAIGNPADTGDNDGIPSVIQIGEVTSKGLEVDLVGDITDNWTGTLSYAYNEAKITGGSPGSIRNSLGDEFVNAPDHTLGAWTRWDFPGLRSAFAVGVDYVSERVNFQGQKVKSYTVWDASWRTEVNEMEIQLNVKNLFDKEYASSGFSKRNGHFPGEPRSVQVQINYPL